MSCNIAVHALAQITHTILHRLNGHDPCHFNHMQQTIFQIDGFRWHDTIENSAQLPVLKSPLNSRRSQNEPGIAGCHRAISGAWPIVGSRSFCSRTSGACNGTDKHGYETIRSFRVRALLATGFTLAVLSLSALTPPCERGSPTQC